MYDLYVSLKENTKLKIQCWSRTAVSDLTWPIDPHSIIRLTQLSSTTTKWQLLLFWMG